MSSSFPVSFRISSRTSALNSLLILPLFSFPVDKKGGNEVRICLRLLRAFLRATRGVESPPSCGTLYSKMPAFSAKFSGRPDGGNQPGDNQSFASLRRTGVRRREFYYLHPEL